MTISSTSSRNDYIGSGAVATYSFAFKIYVKTDLKVTKKDTNNVETVLTVDTDYSVSISANGTGSITLTAGNLPLNYLLTIRRVRPRNQETDIRNQGAFYPEIHEDAFDHFVMIDQQQQDEIDRSLKLSETTTGVNATMPAPVALKWPRWNAAANALEYIDAASLGSISTIGRGLQLVSGDVSVKDPIIVITGSTALTANNYIVVCNSGVALNVTLPTPSTVADATYAKPYIINNKGAGLVTVVGTVDGVVNPTVAQNETMIVYTEGTSWYRQNLYAVNATNLIRDVLTVTGTYTTVAGDDIIMVNAGSAFTITLLSAATYGAGKMLRFLRIDNTTNVVTIDPAGSETINGLATIPLRGDLTLLSDGTNWRILNGTLGPLIRDEQSAENTGIVTVTAGGLQIVALPQMTVSAGDIILVFAKLEITKGATAGQTKIQIAKSSGTAAINWGSNEDAANNSETQNASEAREYAIAIIGKVVVSGTATLVIWGSSAGSDATVAIAKARFWAYVLRGQY